MMNGSPGIYNKTQKKQSFNATSDSLFSSSPASHGRILGHFQKPPAWLAFLSVLSHFLMLFAGYIDDFFRLIGLRHDSCPVDLPRHKVTYVFFHFLL